VRLGASSIARPMPLAPPVTKAVLPLKLSIQILAKTIVLGAPGASETPSDRDRD